MGDEPSTILNAPRRQAGLSRVRETAAKLSELVIEYVPLEHLKPNEYNPNRQSARDFELLKRSITEDGFTQPIVVANDYTIVDGEHRWRAAYDLGMSQVPVVVVPLDAARARVATLRHNRARGSEDVELSTAVLRDLQELGALAWAADSLMISDDALDKLLEDLPAPEALASEEFSQAWVPEHSSGQHGSYEGEDMRVDATPEATERVRDAEQRLEGTDDQAEQRRLLSDRDIYRFTLTFVGDEAELLKDVLGDHPAQAVLRLCREQLERDGAS